jgi:RNA polymerase sigma factor (sigma-70 family)
VPAANQQVTPRPTVPCNINPLDHAKLVTLVCKRYMSATRGKNLDFEDLHQAGMMGVMKACELFDESRGYKFSTYATWWIRAYVRRLTVDQARTVRIPAWFQEEQRLKGTPVRLVTKSLDAPMNTMNGEGEGDCQLDHEAHPDPQIDAPEGLLCINQRKKYAHYLLSTLCDRERLVLTMRMKDATLEVVGNALGVTRERARQIEANALWNLSRKVTRAEREEYALP